MRHDALLAASLGLTLGLGPASACYSGSEENENPGDGAAQDETDGPPPGSSGAEQGGEDPTAESDPGGDSDPGEEPSSDSGGDSDNPEEEDSGGPGGEESGDSGAPGGEESGDSGAPGGEESDSDSGAAGPCPDGPLALPLPGCAPAVLPPTGDDAQDCVDRINQLRWECQCLPPLQRWNAGESCAATQAEYDANQGVPHAGFSEGICDGGWGQNECPGWGSISQTIDGCLQSMWDEGPGEPFSEHGHYINMTNDNHTKVACGWYTTGGSEVWAVQNFQ